eukprot:COSAG05_NODE_1863_length_3942_cov_2.381473_4_plen_380_part_00
MTSTARNIKKMDQIRQTVGSTLSKVSSAPSSSERTDGESEEINRTTTLVMVCIISTVLSPLIMNDTVCLIFSRMIVKDLVGIHDRYPYLLALATATDIGSALTNVGNPQNVLISTAAGLGFSEFFKFMAIPVTVSMLILICMLVYCNSEELNKTGGHDSNVECLALGAVMPTEADSMPTQNVTFSSSPSPDAATGAAELEPAPQAELEAQHQAELEPQPQPGHSDAASMPGQTALKDTMTTAFLNRHIDTSLLLLFSGQFIMVQGFVDTGIPTCIWDATMPPDPLHNFGTCILFSIVIVILSNLISNVPLILMMRPMLRNLMRDDQNEAKAVWLVVAFVCASSLSSVYFRSHFHRLAKLTCSTVCSLLFSQVRWRGTLL